MKKTILTLMLMGNLTIGFGQQNVNFQTACHPEDVKHYDTKTLRERFVMEKVMVADEINLTYSHYDRFIFGGAMPVNKTLKLENFQELGFRVLSSSSWSERAGKVRKPFSDAAAIIFPSGLTAME